MIHKSVTPRRWPPELWLLLALAGAVRFYGLRFGLPHTYARPDELVVAGIGKDFLTGDLNPRFFSYPTLFMYLLAALDYGYYLCGRALGWFQSLDQFRESWVFHWMPFFLIARVVSAIAGTATIAVVYAIGVRLFDRLTGAVAAFFLALAFLHVRDSHFGVTDVSMTFCVTLGVLWLIRGATENRRMPFAVAGLLAGAGASIKYNAVLMVVPLIAALLVAPHAMDREGRPRQPPAAAIPVTVREALVRLLVFTVLMAAAFMAGTPYSILDWHTFIRDVSAESTHIGLAHTSDLGRGGVHHIVFSLRYGLGLPLLVAGLGGLAWLARADWRRAALVGAFPCAYYLLLVPTRTVFVRYAIPLVPFLCLSAAAVVVAAARTAARRYRPWPAPIAWTAALLIVAPSADSVIRIDRVFAATDTRLLLADWIRTNVTPGASIHLCGNIVVQPIVDMGTTRTFRYWGHRGGWNFTEGRPPKPVEGIPEWLVIPETGLPEYGDCPPEVKALALDRYVVARIFKAMDLGGNLFDRQDAFFYPYAGFQGIQRGGPNYVVYARKAENQN